MIKMKRLALAGMADSFTLGLSIESFKTSRITEVVFAFISKAQGVRK